MKNFNKETWEVQENGKDVFIKNPGGKVVTRIRQKTNFVNWIDTEKDNAKLIAAAPEMLEELKSVAGLMLTNSRGHEVDYTLIYEAVDKVIKKATE